jgi:cell wall-associated NlpC family hydrolase
MAVGGQAARSKGTGRTACEIRRARESRLGRRESRRRRSPLRVACAALVVASALSIAVAPAQAAVSIRHQSSHPPIAHPGQTRGEIALRFALAQMGKPYRYGGHGPYAYGCSGVAQQAWRAAGVWIPRTTQQQACFGTPVPLNRIQLGDLVIFYPDASHVGIYAGRGMVVVAPHPGAVIRREPIRWMPVYDVRRP